VAKLDLTVFRARLRPLGRTPVDPKYRLQAWLYGSLIGIHTASELSRLSETDAAVKLACGGRSVSPTALKYFRADYANELQEVLRQVVGLGLKAGLVDPRELAVDSMRLRADVATQQVRTVTRSSRRIDELKAKDISDLSVEERAAVEQKIAEHQSVLDRCKAENRTSFAFTDPQAALMKFPTGASAPGHRIQAVASGTRNRFVVSVLVNGSPVDHDQLRPTLTAARDSLIAAGAKVRPDAPAMQVAADAGYVGQDDLKYIAEQRESGRMDILIPAPVSPTLKGKNGSTLYGSDEFDFEAETKTVVCPALKIMAGPTENKEGRLTWRGTACKDCPLKSSCTDGKVRTWSINPATYDHRHAAAKRINEPGAKARYNQRIATIEPVFGFIQDAMRYGRASSRRTETVRGEVLMKVIAYNLRRLMEAAARPEGRLCVLAVQVTFDRQGVPHIEAPDHETPRFS
jgi:IS5 family transposase